MNIIVCIKQVPNTKEIRIDSKTNNIIREGVPSILNPADRNAAEMALQIKEQMGGVITAITMGPEQAVDVLKEVMDMGVDRGVLFADRAFVGSDTLATGYALAMAAKSFEADLILCGNEAIDGCTGQVGPIIAENLNWPHLSYVCEVNCEGNDFFVTRNTKDRLIHYKCQLPAVFCILKDCNNPRERKKNIGRPEIMNARESLFDKSLIGIAGSPTKVSQIHTSGKEDSSFVAVDGSLSVDERIIRLMNGGILPTKVALTRGKDDELAHQILSESSIKKYISSLS